MIIQTKPLHVETYPTDCTQVLMLASSNDNNGTVSFSPSELYTTLQGDCFEETYSTRQCAEQHGTDPWEPAGRIETFFVNGYWNVTGAEIQQRFEEWQHSFEQRAAETL
jgi:hypothetical protein